MVLKKKRVNKELFENIIKKGHTLFGSFFIFKYLPNSDFPRYAFVVPKKISKKAVDRNKLKRRGYGIIRSIPLSGGLGVFLYKKEGVKVSFEEIKKDINILLKKAKLI